MCPGITADCCFVGEDQQLKKEVPHVYEGGKWKDKLQLSYSKMQVLKYNAFKEMGGETSFAIALLDHRNNGIVLNAMSNRYGSYMYVKEIKEGRSEVALSKEEQIVLEDCMNK